MRSYKQAKILFCGLLIIALCFSLGCITKPVVEDSGRSGLIPCGRYPNCTELKRVYPDGVDSARFECAEDRRRLDRDGDGWACEPWGGK